MSTVLSLHVIRFSAPIFGRLHTPRLARPQYVYSYRRLFLSSKSLPAKIKWLAYRYNWVELPCDCADCLIRHHAGKHKGRRNVITFFVKPAALDPRLTPWEEILWSPVD